MRSFFSEQQVSFKEIKPLLSSSFFLRYLAFGLDGVVAIYAVDQKGVSAEPLRLLQRRYFGNVAAESAITSVEWSADSKLLLTASKCHVMRVYTPLGRSPRFSQYTLTDSAEIVGAYFKDAESYDVGFNRRYFITFDLDYHCQ
jgi:WD40 repeat protein